MIKNSDNEQLEEICTKLLKSFIQWIEIIDDTEKAIILDSAYNFKISIFERKHETLQSRYFLTTENLEKKESIILLQKWKETFSQLVNSDLDRISKDSFKIWFLSLACSCFPDLVEYGKVLWKKLIEGIEYCEKFSIDDIPFPFNGITMN